MPPRLVLLTSLALGACNSPPTAAVVAIDPAEPLVRDDLRLVYEVESTDPDGDPLTALIRWFRDGEEVEDLFNEERVPFSRTARGHTWSVSVIPSDGKDFGPEATAEATVRNGRPSVTTVTLRPTSARTNDTLEAVYIADDPDDDLIEDETYRWLVNGTALSVGGKTLSGFTGFDKGDSVVVEVTVNDGTEDSEPKASSPVVIENTPPTAPTIAIRPVEPGDDDDLICEIVTESDDEDRDPITYDFVWEVDGSETTGGGTEVHPGDTVLAGSTASEEVWTCIVTASDGETDLTPVRSEPVEIAGGVVPGFRGEEGPRFGSGWLQCSGYLDRPSTDDIPDRWADLCAGGAYGRVRLVCGASLSQYRYIDVEKNVFRLGLSGYPERGLISAMRDQNGSSVSMSDNVIYAEDANNPSSGRSWWVTGSGCNEGVASLTVNNVCSWEASNCFGQNLSGSRYLWVYVAP